MRPLLTLAMLGVAAPLAAQGFWQTSARLGPQMMSYDIKAPVNQKITEFTVPLYVAVPVTERFSLDVGTAWAHVQVESPGAATSTLSGLTDTQLRGNYTIGTDFIVLTAGINLPTGQTNAGPAEQAAATRIASDFLVFPINGFGTGAGGTGGIAVARPLGNWNLGVGVAMRHSLAYDPFQDASGNKLHYQPGDEYRARVGLDHPFGTGRITMGLTYSKFGSDEANSFAYNTGDRYIAQGSISNSVRNVDVTLAGWNLFRASGELADGSPTGAENVAKGGLALGFHTPGGTIIEPSVEGRLWARDGSRTSYMGTVGLRANWDMGAYAITPFAGYTMGQVSDPAGNSTLTGFRATLAIRLGGY
jgi:hypothetical protein